MSIRLAYVLGFLAVCFLLLTSVYLQVFENVIPCPLCSLQRLTFGLLGIFLALGIGLHAHYWGRLLINFFIAITSLLGILLAGRQIWMQHLPPTSKVECGVSLQYMVQAFPLSDVLRKILLEGSTECTQRGWEFLHLNMAEWALAWFILFLLLALYGFFNASKQHSRN